MDKMFIVSYIVQISAISYTISLVPRKCDVVVEAAPITPSSRDPISNYNQTTSFNEFDPEPDQQLSTRALDKDAVLWPGGKLYYEFGSSDFTQKQKNQIKSAMKAIEEGTCIKFYPKTDTTGKNYVKFVTKGSDGREGCYSNIGVLESEFTEQEIILTPNYCDSGPNYGGSAAHEIIHALGFQHEFQRGDRENYITFHPENIDKEGLGMTDDDVKSAWDPIKDSLTKGVPFNFKSIMNYDPLTGSRNVYPRRPVFTERKPRPKGVVAPIGEYKNMGQECRISAGDRRLINLAYAKECGLKSVEVYKNGVPITGTTCKQKLKAIGDDIKKQ